MKKLILNLSICILSAYSIQAQQHFNVTYFQIDESFIIETSSVKPKGLVDYYSTPEGGFLQSSNLANDNGIATLETDLKHLPAFSLHDKYVQHLGEREFMLKDLKGIREGEELLLQWQGAASQLEPIEYVLLKSIDGKVYEPISIFPVLSNESQEYSYTDVYDMKASYRVAVRKNKLQERYLSKVVKIQSETNPYTLYPTYTQGLVHIDFVNSDIQGEYKIISQNGQIISQGLLSTQFNTIDVSALSKGTYMIKILANGVSKTEKISKQ